MDNERRDTQFRYFDMLADFGITKHIGSLKATTEMVELCKIDENAYVLDVGCGVGLTPIYLARTYGCHIVGIDFVPKMIERSEENARRKKAGDRVTFQVADARDLPFEDNTFDIVIIESVNAFIPDKEKAFSEYIRVAKAGGYVGMNESTWLDTPSQDAIKFMAAVGAEPLTTEEWEGLMVQANLQDVYARSYGIDVREEAKGRLKRFGLSTLLRSVARIFPVYFGNPAARSVIKDAIADAPPHVGKLMGYGVYVGRVAK